MTEKKLLTIRETARRYHLPECAVRRWAKTGELTSVKSGSRAYIIPASVDLMLDLHAGQTAADGNPDDRL